MAKPIKRRINFIFIFVLLFLVVLILWDYRSSWIAGRLNFNTVHDGYVTHEKSVKAVFANTEIVVTSPAEGSVIPADEGKRFKRGEKVATVVPTGVGHDQTSSGITVSAPISGLFFSSRDGLEQVATPENLMNLELGGLLAQVENNQPLADNNTDDTSGSDKSENITATVSINSPIGKMVNNLYPSWAFLYLGEEDHIAKGDSIKVAIDGEEYTGAVMRIYDNPKGAVIRFSQYISSSSEKRTMAIIWSFQTATRGLVVPTDAVCASGEEKGVYILLDGVIRYRSVVVLDSNETVTCVEGLPQGTQVVVNPRKGIEGMFIRD